MRVYICSKVVKCYYENIGNSVTVMFNMDKKYDKPSVAVDIVIFTIHEKKIKVLLVKRGIEPFKDSWALPGGFVNKKTDDSLEDTAIRELKEETGADVQYIEQLATFGNSKRDPRDWTISVTYFALMPYEQIKLESGSDASEAKWWTVQTNTVKTKLAFDHKNILKIAIERLRSKAEYTSLAGHLLGEEFTLPKLQETIEILLDSKIDKTAFRRNLSKFEIVEDTGRHEPIEKHRPAKLYTFKKGADNAIFFPRSIMRSVTTKNK